tara:strand:- start:379 stop:549 length:171 start_codon:yes stop_codon:yes gene_type:complete
VNQVFIDWFAEISHILFDFNAGSASRGKRKHSLQATNAIKKPHFCGALKVGGGGEI